MNRLEQQAIDKEREKEHWKKATAHLLQQNRLSHQQLSLVIDKVFLLGHNAGHCRGEQYETLCERNQN